MGHPRIARRGIAWKTCPRERWDPDRQLDYHVNCCHTWGLHDRACVVLSGCSLARCILARVAATLSDMSNACLLLSSHSNSTFIMFHLLMSMILTTLIVKELLNIKY
jgi:hypothetical protein